MISTSTTRRDLSIGKKKRGRSGGGGGPRDSIFPLLLLLLLLLPRRRRHRGGRVFFSFRSLRSQRKKKTKKRDGGALFLALALFAWACAGGSCPFFLSLGGASLRASGESARARERQLEALRRREGKVFFLVADLPHRQRSSPASLARSLAVSLDRELREAQHHVLARHLARAVPCRGHPRQGRLYSRGPARRGRRDPGGTSSQRAAGLFSFKAGDGEAARRLHRGAAAGRCVFGEKGERSEFDGARFRVQVRGFSPHFPRRMEIDSRFDGDGFFRRQRPSLTEKKNRPR